MSEYELEKKLNEALSAIDQFQSEGRKVSSLYRGDFQKTFEKIQKKSFELQASGSGPCTCCGGTGRRS